MLGRTGNRTTRHSELSRTSTANAVSLHYNEAALEIFRDVVQGPETSGMPEIVDILKRHFEPAVAAMKPRSVRQVLAELDDDDEDDRPPTDARGDVIRAV